MEIQELRLGNYYRWESYAYEAQDNMSINIWKIEDYHAVMTHGDIYMRHCFPVLLTEEWLRKFGFERFPWGLVKGNLLFRDDLKNPCETLTLEIGNGFRTEIKYVHQLQNLYYALTNEELTVL